MLPSPDASGGACHLEPLFHRQQRDQNLRAGSILDGGITLPSFYHGADPIQGRHGMGFDGAARGCYLTVVGQNAYPGNLIASVLTTFGQHAPQAVQGIDALPAQLVFERRHLLDGL